MSLTLDPPRPRGEARGGQRRRGLRRTSLLAHGEPVVWLMGGALALALAMIVGLLALVLWRGGATFLVGDILRLETRGGRVLLGEVTRSEQAAPAEEMYARVPEEQAGEVRERVEEAGGSVRRRLLRTGNFDLTQRHSEWIEDPLVVEESRPELALLLERFEWGRFYGLPARLEVAGEVVAEGPEAAWAAFREHHPSVMERRAERKHLETVPTGEVSQRQEEERLALRRVELEHGEGSPEAAAARGRFERRMQELEAEHAAIREQIVAIDAENDRYRLVMATGEGTEASIPLDEVVRAVPANQLGWFGKLRVYLARWHEFLTEEPRESNTGGGVWPAIMGTVLMTMLMSVLVVPFGVLAALYLREYAKQGHLVSMVRIAVGNLAGVPSIVFGVFGLGFFCYIIGASIDELLFYEKLPTPTFGTGGLMWASLTLALLTLPVVIVATEEALAAVPNSMREGSYACGATKWQTIRRIVLPRALPGIMTGMILAIARGAGEVAPLMLVGVAASAPEPATLLHPERSFMHLGYHIFEVGFKSQDSEAARPIVFTTTLLLIAIVVALNLLAIWIRARLRRRFAVAR